jgi:hypothetical protein
MNIKCSFCEATAKGSRDELQDKGWARAIIYAPVRKTVTACPAHQAEIAEEVEKYIGKKY